VLAASGGMASPATVGVGGGPPLPRGLPGQRQPDNKDATTINVASHTALRGFCIRPLSFVASFGTPQQWSMHIQDIDDGQCF
jgi:hypothetical protein